MPVRTEEEMMEAISNPRTILKSFENSQHKKGFRQALNWALGKEIKCKYCTYIITKFNNSGEGYCNCEGFRNNERG